MGAGNSERRCRRRGAAPRSARESGATLVEILISVLLLGLIGTTMATAVLTTVVTSGVQDRQAIADSELRRYADYIRSRNYVGCADEAHYAFVAGTQTPPGVTGGVVPGSVKFWSNRGPSGLGVEPTFVAREAAASPCKTGSVLPDPGLQQMTLEVTVPGSPVVRQQTTVIKRDPNNRYSD